MLHICTSDTRRQWAIVPDAWEVWNLCTDGSWHYAALSRLAELVRYVWLPLALQAQRWAFDE
jgi:hypothetical protein